MAIKGQLIVRLDSQLVMEYTLSELALTIGRLPDNRLVLPQPDVSRRHAEIRIENGAAVLTDVGSTYGTFVNGVRLLPQQPLVLTDGARIQIGPYTLTYHSHIIQKDADPLLSDEAQEPGQAGAPFPLSGLGARSHPALLKPPRPTWPAPSSQGEPSSAYLRYLPVIFHDNDFLARLLMVFETIWEPLEQRQDHVAMYFDPRTCPASLLPWLAGWFDLVPGFHWPEGRLRALLAAVVELHRWSGTEYGLARMIEVCTGLTPEITEVPSKPFVFRIKVTPPKDYNVDSDLIEELVRAYKPAHIGYFIEVEA